MFLKSTTITFFYLHFINQLRVYNSFKAISSSLLLLPVTRLATTSSSRRTRLYSFFNKQNKLNQFKLKFPLLTSLMATSTTTELSKLNTEQSSKPSAVYRKDYSASKYEVPKIRLSFDLNEEHTTITTILTVKISKDNTDFSNLILDGENLQLQSVKLNGIVLQSDQYRVDPHTLQIYSSTIRDQMQTAPSSEFILETVVIVHPNKNLALSGLYRSSEGLLCTQCEAVGFRKITYHFDRPDILSIYSVRIEASKSQYPLLLSNGNKMEEGVIAENPAKHFVVWEDPFPKPSYLFALVAGELQSIHDTYVTTSGRTVRLGIYSDKFNVDKLDHAMYSLKASMKWDEDTFGLECDLDEYNIVATNDFNMGAMENKGLNIFNAAYVLADPSSATDTDYERILGVIGHEYFHNWTGNRVTVRDWFQLTLKEGLTVFRDQWFSSDLTSAAVKRIEDVRSLRSRQFAEDAGPMAHPIRPDSYTSMDNFYTGTVYSKGAEVVGLYKTLLGEDGFKKGFKLYIERFDGMAVTCDDFLQAMGDANQVDLSQMSRWYAQAGTPVVQVQQVFDESKSEFRLHLKQFTPTTPGINQRQEDKGPVIIPIAMGLLDASTGTEVVPTTVLRFTEAEQTFTFPNIKSKPIVSFLRDFSAPVNVEIDQTDDELIFLMAYDTDSFNRWDASSRYVTKLLLSWINNPEVSLSSVAVPSAYLAAIKTLLNSYQTLDMSLLAYTLQLPDEMTLMNQMQVMDIDRLHSARKVLKKEIGKALFDDFLMVYKGCGSDSNEYVFNAKEVGRRRLKNTCLDYLTAGASLISEAMQDEVVKMVKLQFDQANCMTDKLASLSLLASMKSRSERQAVLEKFYSDSKGNALVLNKWFAIQSMADYDGLFDDLKLLMKHPDFTLNNPNRVRSVVGAFSGNLFHFHDTSGSGYKFMGDSILEIDKVNPQVAARMVSCFAPWRKFDGVRKEFMEEQLKRIQSAANLSADTLENTMRCLN